MTRQDLHGIVSIVTGGGSRSGTAIGGKLAGAGPSVTIIGREATRLDAAAQDLGSSVRAHATDVSDGLAVKMPSTPPWTCRVVGSTCSPAVCRSFRRCGLRRLGIRCLAEGHRLNVTGPFLCGSEAYRIMRGNGRGGRMINIGSISGWTRPIRGGSDDPHLDGRPRPRLRFGGCGRHRARVPPHRRRRASDTPARSRGPAVSGRSHAGRQGGACLIRHATARYRSRMRNRENRRSPLRPEGLP